MGINFQSNPEIVCRGSGFSKRRNSVDAQAQLFQGNAPSFQQEKDAGFGGPAYKPKQRRKADNSNRDDTESIGSGYQTYNTEYIEKDRDS